MGRLQTALTVLSLSLSVGLGACLWTLWERLPASAPAPAAAPVATPAPAFDEARLRSLEDAVAELRARPEAPSLPQAGPRASAAPASGPAQPPAPAAAPLPAKASELLTALNDPEVKARLKSILREPDAGSGYSERLLQGMDLPQPQRQEFDKAMVEHEQKVGEVLGSVWRKERTAEQARLAVEQQRIETDNRILALLGPEKFRTYQERVKPIRESTDQGMAWQMEHARNNRMGRPGSP